MATTPKKKKKTPLQKAWDLTLYPHVAKGIRVARAPKKAAKRVGRKMSSDNTALNNKTSAITKFKNR